MIGISGYWCVRKIVFNDRASRFRQMDMRLDGEIKDLDFNTKKNNSQIEREVMLLDLCGISAWLIGVLGILLI